MFYNISMNLFQKRSKEDLVAFVVSFFVLLSGFINIVSAIRPALAERVAILSQILPIGISFHSRTIAVLLGFSLIVLSTNITKRKERAWLLVVCALFASAIIHLIKGLDYEEATYSAVVGIIIIFLKPIFFAASDRPSAKRALKILFFSLGFNFIYGLSGLYILEKRFLGNSDFVIILKQFWKIFFIGQNTDIIPHIRYDQYLISSVFFVGIVTIAYSLLLFVRPVFIESNLNEMEQGEASNIVRKYGSTLLAPIAILEDKKLFFNESRDVFISYVVKGRFALALGPPIGNQRKFQKTINSFGQYCKGNGWEDVYYQIRKEELFLFKNKSHLKIGEEAIVDVRRFSIDTSNAKSLRNSASKLERMGYSYEVLQPPFSKNFLRILKSISDEWLAKTKGQEKRFSLGWFHDNYINKYPILVIKKANDDIVSFTNILNGYSKNEISIDMMRRGNEAPNGINDFMFVSLINWARKNNISYFNLGLSALAGIKKKNNSVSEKFLGYLFKHLNKFYNFKGLHTYKEKFDPQWISKFLVYSSGTDLFGIFAALIRADSNEKVARYFKK